MAEGLARSSGTSEDILQRVLGQEFLLKCLRKAKFSPDLLQDTADACEINDLNALVLGSGLLSVSEASEKLFLMQDEASTVVAVCRKECLRAGVNFGDGSQLTAEELAENDEEEPAAPAPPPPAVTPTPTPPAPPAPLQSLAPAPARGIQATHIPPPPNHSQQFRPSPSLHEKKPQTLASKAASVPLPPSVTASAVVTLQPFASAPAAASSMLPKPAAPEVSTSKETGTASRHSSSTIPAADLGPRRSMTTTSSVEQHDPNFLIKPPVMGSALGSLPMGSSVLVTPVASRSHIPKPMSVTPATPATGGSTPRERTAAKPVIRASPATLATPPTSSGGASEPGSRPTPSMNGRHTPAASSSAAKPPRPSSAPLSARAASTTVPLGKDRPMSAAVITPVQPTRLPSYAKPTASHKARVTKEDTDVPSTSSPPAVTFASTNKPLRRIQYMGPRPSTSPDEKKEPKKPIFDNIRSNLLRPTVAFLAWSSGKSKFAKDADLRSSQSLQSESIGQPIRGRVPNSAPPKGVIRELSATTASALSPSVTQSNSIIMTTPEPFRLASAERHLKAQEELAKKKEKARLESHIPKFRASPTPNSVERTIQSGKSELKRTTASAQTDE
ncbi:hypothetical protein VaNZ11_001972 [Volvox africanus]|uniref:Uncharacterized protein n=1 Tax=Volvox africanus TaxID=51714 RepID=A0ABQ5RQT1_9CHLO|nr:hypothetical protein VaNZ11_001972 [Volvox africanus]